MGRTRRIFISDIHMGDARSMDGRYCWFRDNIGPLAAFLDEQRTAADVKEVVLLGDLFDEWIIPLDDAPLTSFADICANPANAPVIDGLKALAASPEVKLSYVPGNHDMGLDPGNIGALKQFLGQQFPGMRYICNPTVPLGTYSVGTIAAEHGDRYCLFNAPDRWTAPDTFVPLGYFISRMVAYKAKKRGKPEDLLHILGHFLQDFIKHPHLIPDLLHAVAEDAGLPADCAFDMTEVPGFGTATLSLSDVSKRYNNLPKAWEKASGNINLPTAIASDIGNLSFAASLAYFWQMHANVNIVIFGHTHCPTMDKNPVQEPNPESGLQAADIPCSRIYANCGAWVDSVDECTYVETEEQDKRHYVRVKSYPGNAVLDEGFVEL